MWFGARATTALTGVHRFTPYRLAWVIAEPSLWRRHGLTPVRGLGSVALAASVVHQVRAAGKLNYFAPIADTPGFPRALVRTIRELRLQRIGQSRSRPSRCRLVPTSPPCSPNTRVNSRRGPWSMKRTSTRPLPNASGPAGTRSGSAAAIARIRCRHPGRMRSAGRTPPPGSRRIRPGTRTGRVQQISARLQEHLFKPVEVPLHAPDESFTVFSASTEALECVEIARRIRDAAAGVRLRFDQIAILLRNAPGIPASGRRSSAAGRYTRRDRRAAHAAPRYRKSLPDASALRRRECLSRALRRVSVARRRALASSRSPAASAC